MLEQRDAEHRDVEQAEDRVVAGEQHGPDFACRVRVRQPAERFFERTDVAIGEVALSGEGADELLGGYARVALALGRGGEVPGPAAKTPRRGARGRPPISFAAL